MACFATSATYSASSIGVRHARLVVSATHPPAFSLTEAQRRSQGAENRSHASRAFRTVCSSATTIAAGVACNVLTNLVRRSRSQRLCSTQVRYAVAPGDEEVAGNHLVVTTSKHATQEMETQAEEVSRRLGAPFVQRKRQSMRAVLEEAESGLAYLIRRVHREDNVVEIRHEICDGDGNHVFANPRMWSIVGEGDKALQQPLVRAVTVPDEPPLEHVIDATAGLGGTALRIAYACGQQCHVTAVEVSAPLACQLEFGLQRLAAQNEAWSEPASRLRAVHADAVDFLRAVAAGTVADAVASAATTPLLDAGCSSDPWSKPADVVYLNPCMDGRRPSKEDIFLHRVARLGPITRDIFDAAAACATRRVVLRHAHGAGLPFGLEEKMVRRVGGRASDFIVVDTR